MQYLLGGVGASPEGASPVSEQHKITRDRTKGPLAIWRMRVRALSGVPVEDTDGMPFPTLTVEGDGVDWQLAAVSCKALFELIEFWGCPVTIAPPENGVPYWSLELEDGTHEVVSLLDMPKYEPLVARLEDEEDVDG